MDVRCIIIQFFDDVSLCCAIFPRGLAAAPFVSPSSVLLPLLCVDSSRLCVLLSSRKIGIPRKKVGKLHDSLANSSSSLEEDDETLS